MKKGYQLMSLEERQTIEKLIGVGLSFYHIGLQLKRSSWAIINEVKRNGGRYCYRATIAHERSLARRQEKRAKQRKALSERARAIVEEGLAGGWSYSEIRKKARIEWQRLMRYINVDRQIALFDSPLARQDKTDLTHDLPSQEDRISALEMQVDILVETIKYMKTTLENVSP